MIRPAFPTLPEHGYISFKQFLFSIFESHHGVKNVHAGGYLPVFIPAIPPSCRVIGLELPGLEQVIAPPVEDLQQLHLLDVRSSEYHQPVVLQATRLENVWNEHPAGPVDPHQNAAAGRTPVRIHQSYPHPVALQGQKMLHGRIGMKAVENRVPGYRLDSGEGYRKQGVQIHRIAQGGLDGGPQVDPDLRRLLQFQRTGGPCAAAGIEQGNRIASGASPEKMDWLVNGPPFREN